MGGVRKHYEQGPAAIESRSFEIIRDTLSCYAVDERLLDVIVRVVHAGGDFNLANLLGAADGAIEAAPVAFSKGGELFCDVAMLASGISRKECARLGLQPVSFIHTEEAAARAEAGKITRAMAAVDMAVERGIRLFAFGNAPTALFRLLEHCERGTAVDFVCGMPVGFVGAADSKADLAASGLPAIWLRGPRGGSGLCAACVNALLRMA